MCMYMSIYIYIYTLDDGGGGRETQSCFTLRTTLQTMHNHICFCMVGATLTHVSYVSVVPTNHQNN